METLFTLPVRFIACFLVPLFLISTIYTANAQRLKLSLNTGASFSNFMGANDSGPESYTTSFPASVYTSSTSAPPPTGTYTYQKPYYKTSATRDVRTGFYAGILMEFKITKRFSVEHGVSYVQKGIDMNFSSPIETSTAHGTYSFVRSISTNYISTPLVARYYLDRKGRFYVLGGWYDAFAVSSKVKEASSSGTEVITTGETPQTARWATRETSIKTNVIDGGLIAGAGFSLPVGERFLIGLDARINVGLIRLNGDSSRDNYLGLSQSSKNINLETGLRLAYVLPVDF